MDKLIVYEENDGYGTILINRPDKRNAISTKMAEELLLLFQEIKNHSISFLLIKSEGDNAFCAGGDLNDFHRDLNEDEAYDMLSTMKQVRSEERRVGKECKKWGEQKKEKRKRVRREDRVGSS